MIKRYLIIFGVFVSLAANVIVGLFANRLESGSVYS